MKKEPISFEQFKKTIFYTSSYIRIPLLNERLDKVEYMKKGVYDIEAVEKKLMELYIKNRHILI